MAGRRGEVVEACVLAGFLARIASIYNAASVFTRLYTDSSSLLNLTVCCHTD